MDDEFFPLIRPSIQIPDSWSPEVACEIADFLSDIAYAIWVTHSSAMMQYLERTTTPRTRAVVLDDDLPF